RLAERTSQLGELRDGQAAILGQQSGRRVTEVVRQFGNSGALVDPNLVRHVPPLVAPVVGHDRPPCRPSIPGHTTRNAPARAHGAGPDRDARSDSRTVLPARAAAAAEPSTCRPESRRGDQRSMGGTSQATIRDPTGATKSGWRRLVGSATRKNNGCAANAA